MIKYTNQNLPNFFKNLCWWLLCLPGIVQIKVNRRLVQIVASGSDDGVLPCVILPMRAFALFQLSTFHSHFGPILNGPSFYLTEFSLYVCAKISINTSCKMIKIRQFSDNGYFAMREKIKLDCFTQ